MIGEILREKDMLLSLGQKFLLGMIVFLPFSIAGVEIACAAVFLFVLLSSIAGHHRSYRYSLVTAENICLFLFIFFCVVSVANSGELWKKSLFALTLKWSKYLLFFWAVIFLSCTRKFVRRALNLFLVTACVVAFDAFFQLGTGKDLFRGYSLASCSFQGLIVKPVSASFKHYNSLGAFLVPVILIAAAYLSSGNARRKGLLILTFLLLGVTLTLTFSRGAWVGLAAGMFFMVAVSRNYKIFLFVLAALAAGLFVSSDFRERFFSMFMAGGDSSRLIYWKETLILIQKNPLFGCGIGTFMDKLHQQNPVLIPLYAHNCFLQICAETGVLSLLAFLSFVGFHLFKAVKSYLKSSDHVHLGLICAFVGMLVHAFFDNTLYSVQLAFLFWMLFGLLAGQTRNAL